MDSSYEAERAAAVGDGVRRVNRGTGARRRGMCAVTLLIALPLSIALRRHAGAPSRSQHRGGCRRGGADYGWWREFEAQATGLGTTFGPSIGGFGAVLANISGLLDNEPLAATIAGATAAWLLIWSFLSGGIIDRLARDRPTRTSGFFAACGVARLAAAAARRHRRRRLLRPLRGGCTGWIFDDGYRAADRRGHRRNGPPS